MSFSFASSSASLKKARCTMEFSAVWGEGEIFDWYRNTLTSRMINRLEVRITRDAIPHRFVVAYMQDGSICRFDRRPRTPQSVFVPIGPQSPGEEPSCRAADEACIVNRAELLEIELSTNWEIRLNLPVETDVLLILSACFAIAQDKLARNYALREYNCYFFSWTIVMLVTRHLLPFTVPSPAAVESRFSSRIAETSAAVGDRLVQALLHMGLSAVAPFDSATGKRLNQGLSKQELAVWGLPSPVLRGLLRQCLKIQLRCGLKKKVDEQVRSQLETRAAAVFRSLLEASGRATEEDRGGAREATHNTVADVVQNRLWLNELLADLQQPIHEGILQVLWDNILDAIAESYNDANRDVVHQGFRKLPLLHRLKYHLLGKNVIQFSQIWSEALRAALPAARLAGHGKYRPEKSHGDMFDLAFRAGVAAALQAAQDVVRRTGPELANPKRDEMWEVVWSVWDEVWERSRVTTQAMAVSLVESTLADLVGRVAEDVVKELGDNDRQKVQATIQSKRNQKRRLQGEGAELSLEVFQLNIRGFIRSVPGQTLEHQKRIEEAMSRAWDVSRKTYTPLSPVTP
ncbi:hypothetical protein FS749_011506 [Ceratobasidium sp. UAMH 11750]|nr:hypothetical protein FS749_011506 [Ceratobasidium sp. UAMH 11750]